MAFLLALSGPIAVGKSAVGQILLEKHHFLPIKSGDFLKNILSERKQEVSRTALQELGDHLDRETDYLWLLKDVSLPAMQAGAPSQMWLLDAVRKKRQVEHFRERLGEEFFHVHFSAPEEVLARRYRQRQESNQDYSGAVSYEDAVKHPNERAARSLCEIADLGIDLNIATPDQAASLILQKINQRC